MNAPRILGIDPGSCKGLGWAVMSAGAEAPRLHRSGVVFAPTMGPDERQPLWRILTSVLDAAWVGGGFDCVAYERVHRHNGVHAAHMYGGQVAVIQAWCDRVDVPYTTVQVGAVKRFLKCSAAGKDKEKAMVDAAHALGYTSVEDHNEADAVGIAGCGLEQWQTGKNVFGN